LIDWYTKVWAPSVRKLRANAGSGIPSTVIGCGASHSPDAERTYSTKNRAPLPCVALRSATRRSPTAVWPYSVQPAGGTKERSCTIDSGTGTVTNAPPGDCELAVETDAAAETHASSTMDSVR